MDFELKCRSNFKSLSRIARLNCVPLTGLSLVIIGFVSYRLFRDYSSCNLFFNCGQPLVQCLYSENRREVFLFFFIEAKNPWRCIFYSRTVYRERFSILKQTRKGRGWRKTNVESRDKLVDKMRRIKRDSCRKKYVYWTLKSR